ncbi:MAG: hypothetical protein HQK53_17815 [Oligoflexia bacterium]|nr:hypothetical protein [Oligoflexia bacterium]
MKSLYVCLINLIFVCNCFAADANYYWWSYNQEENINKNLPKGIRPALILPYGQGKW